LIYLGTIVNPSEKYYNFKIRTTMGRAFEYRKATKMKRWGNMARVFTKLGKQITIAVREGGPESDTNPRLRVLIQQSKKENMPKENVERAIKKAISKDEADYKEVVYEGYGPNGIAIVIETATDNPTRTVANVRSYLTRHGGSLGTSGCLQFLFDHKCVFKIAQKEGVSIEDLELELIDFGVDELVEDEDGIVLYGEFQSYSPIQKYLEENGFEIFSAEFERIPNDMKELTEEQKAQVTKLLDKIEDDEDVQNVFHNMVE
jgi:YebC/PmpR family DNA-binding regulatory protein